MLKNFKSIKTIYEFKIKKYNTLFMFKILGIKYHYLLIFTSTY
jgi:hypothetical protein